MGERDILKSAQFNRALTAYMYLIVMFWLLVTLIGIPVIPIWILTGWIFTRRYFNSLECTLTTKTIEVKKGSIFRVEKTIPLDRVQDLTLREGPLLRALKLCMIEIETAGQSNPQGSDAKIIGIDDAKDFRNAVMKQRDLLIDNLAAKSSTVEREYPAEKNVLFEIRDTLIKIEKHLAKKLD